MHHNPAVGRVQTLGDLVFTRAEASTVWDSSGKPYIDLYGNTSLAFGHEATPVLQAFADSPPLNLGLYKNRHRDLLADKLASLLPGYTSIQFYSTGTGANEGMLRYAMEITGRNAFCGFFGSFHGYSKATASISDMDSCNGTRIEGYFQLPYPGYDARKPVPERYDQMALSDIAAAIDAHGAHNVAGLVIEPILSKPVVRPPEGWLRDLKRDVLAPRGILLLVDEFLTSARTGHWSESLAQGAQPDIISLGKSFKGGMPFSAIACLAEHAPKVRSVKGTDSAAGQAPVCNLVLSTIDRIISEGIFEHQREIEQSAKEVLSALDDSPVVVRVAAFGALAGIEFTNRDAASAVGKACLDAGVIVSVIRDCIRLTPAFNISLAEWRQGLKVIVESCRELNQSAQSAAAQ